MENQSRKSYPTDVTDEEWAFVAPYLTLMNEAAPQRRYDLREVFNALRWMVRAGAPWRLLPHECPPWPAVYQQTQCRCPLGDRRRLLRGDGPRPARRAALVGGADDPTAVIRDARTVQSTPERGGRAATTNACPKRWPGCTSSPSPA